MQQLVATAVYGLDVDVGVLVRGRVGVRGRVRVGVRVGVRVRVKVRPRVRVTLQTSGNRTLRSARANSFMRRSSPG